MAATKTEPDWREFGVRVAFAVPFLVAFWAIYGFRSTLTTAIFAGAVGLGGHLFVYGLRRAGGQRIGALAGAVAIAGVALGVFAFLAHR